MTFSSDESTFFKQISDRVTMVANQSSIQRTAYDHLRKTRRDDRRADIESELTALENSAMETVLLSSELIRAIQNVRRMEA